MYQPYFSCYHSIFQASVLTIFRLSGTDTSTISTYIFQNNSYVRPAVWCTSVRDDSAIPHQFHLIILNHRQRLVLIPFVSTFKVTSLTQFQVDPKCYLIMALFILLLRWITTTAHSVPHTLPMFFHTIDTKESQLVLLMLHFTELFLRSCFRAVQIVPSVSHFK